MALINDPLVDELTGLCRGVLANGAVDRKEAEYLRAWFQKRPHATRVPMVATVYNSVIKALPEGDNLEYLSHEAWQASAAQTELFNTLQQFCGFGAQPDEIDHSTRLPLDNPPPPITFAGKHFCFTGRFNFGKRGACQDEVIKRGATAAKDVSQKTDVLVIGTYIADKWVHSTHGRKIEKAVDLRASGMPLAIISEEHWQGFLED